MPTLAVQAITTGITAAQLVQALLAADPGLSIVGGSEHYAGDPRASGFYTDVTTEGGHGIQNFFFPLEDGVLLTTGFITGALGPQTVPDAGHSYYDEVPSLVYRDALLAAIVGVPATDTYDACSLTFDFVPDGTSITMHFVFASEEYNEFVGTPFNDTFGLFLNTVNKALLPGTLTPITINNVNLGTNPGYYRDNDGGSLFLQYDGVVGDRALNQLLATATVVPGQRYTMRIAICDIFDGYYDSAVFCTQLRSLGGNPGGPGHVLLDSNIPGTDNVYIPLDPGPTGPGCIRGNPAVETGSAGCRPLANPTGV